MPCLSFFADEQDLQIILARLNGDPEVAFVVPIGIVGPEISDTGAPTSTVYRRRWRAVPTVAHIADGYHSLWHVPGGPLPLIPDLSAQGMPLVNRREKPVVTDPWSGWVEDRPTNPLDGPYFGPGAHPNVRLTLWTRQLPYSESERADLRVQISYWIDNEVLVASDFQWTGSHFAPAPGVTQRWWSRLRRWMSSAAVPLRTQGRRPIIFWAFPSALRKLQSGVPYSANNWNLDASIRQSIEQ